MKRVLSISLIYAFLCASILCVNATDIQQAQQKQDLPEVKVDLRDQAGIELPAGLVIPVLNMQEVSTQTCPEGYKTKFVSTNDIFMGDAKVIPENTEFYGYIEKINEPVIGTNASMKIKITKMILPDGYEQYIKAYIYTANDNLIGGELTPPSEWVKMPHYQDKYQGIAWIHRGATLQVRPGGRRSMGVHTSVPAGERELIILVAPINMSHTYID
ncbi:MAG: hypothetical protein SPL73_00710 [Cyanobacteriota bacterium]|nr:hypothetical protein [Cyanobacteriota bacterium]MDY6359514.1 hypothetical protein [Cyanobacteriota bacterium]MDY6363390.1 hypothetical protein [Cyanobacteriota bacterium]MDY6382489.1 hypothetical protein [Cyanobacteriota bacterium]